MYKDKDLKSKNQISKIEQRKNNRKKLTSAFLALILSIEGTVCLQSLKYNKSYVIKHINPFNGNSIRFDYVADYQAKRVIEFIFDNEFKDIDEYMKNLDLEEKKAYALYFALLENQYLTDAEKESLTSYIQYFIDNKYLDYEYIYNNFSTFFIPFNYKNLFKNENIIGGQYNSLFNYIIFTSQKGRKISISHEIYHAEDKIIKFEDNSSCIWFIEGLTALLDYEYNDMLPFSYKEEVTFCRILCELVGSDVLFETRAKGNINILINAFINKGFERQEIINLFDLFNEFSIEKRKENISLNELKIEIIQTLKNMYLKINENKKYVSPIFYQYIVCIAESSAGFNLDEFIFDKYYFNSLKKDTVPITKGVNMDENTYELVESIYEYYDDYIQQTNEFSRSPANTTQQRHLTKTKKIYMTKESLNEKITGMIDYLSENQKSK